MKINLHYNKSVEENASIYFDKAKKQKKKLEGAKKALEISKNKLKETEKTHEKTEVTITKKQKLEWYEKFRWFISSEGFLCIGGRDATTNEIVIKKYTDKDDIVFHTDMAGSPFFVIKTDNKKPTEITLNETAIATASYSRAWKNGLATLDVFYVKPEQVSKEANTGEFMAKGSFMVRGKTTYIKPEVKLAIANKDGKIIAGPIEAIKSQTNKFIIILPGDKKSSDIAKLIKKQINGKIDEIIRMLPSGGISISDH